MLSELLQKLEGEHGIAPAQGTGILNTITQHIKQQFPVVGEMLDKVLGSQANSTVNSSNPLNTSVNESSLQQLEDLAKSKLGGLFGGNKL